MSAFVPENMKLVTTFPVVSFDMAGLSDWASGLCAKYEGLVITEEQVPEIKAEMAELNKAKNQIDIARKETVKRLSAPLKEFEADVRKITAIFDNAYKALGEQVKAFTERERDEKRKVVQVIIKEVLSVYEVEPFDIPIDDKWLNKSTSQKAIREAIIAIVQQRIEVDTLKAQADQAKQERAAAIEQAVAGHNKNYYGLNLPVAQFMTERNLDLATPIADVLAGIYKEVAALVRANEEKQAQAQAENLQGLIEQAQVDEPTPQAEPEPVAETPVQETPQATVDADPVKLSIILEFDPSCEKEIRATLNTLKTMCVSFAARKC